MWKGSYRSLSAPNAEDEDVVSCVFVCIKQAGVKFQGELRGERRRICAWHTDRLTSPTLRLLHKSHTHYVQAVDLSTFTRKRETSVIKCGQPRLYIILPTFL